MSTPIYLQIKNIIKEEILNKQSNEVIESERALANRLSASRMTVRRAIDELVEEGYLYRKKNKGTFVADKTLWKKSTIEQHTYRDNIEYHLINFDVKFTVKKEVSEKLELPQSNLPSIIRAVRVVYKNKKPQKIEEFFILRSHIKEKNINKFDKLLDLNSYLSESVMSQKFIPMIVPIKYAQTLKLAIDQPIIMTEGIVRDTSGMAYIYYKAYSHPKYDTIETTF